MQQSGKIFTVAALAGFGAILAGFAAVPAGSARAVQGAAMEVAAGRVAGAGAVGAAAKGDLLVGAACFGQEWPEVAPACLVTADGTAARAVRTVTLGTQLGEATTVLVRLPAPQTASR